MTFVFVLFAVGLGLELLLHGAPTMWRARRWLAGAALVCNGFAAAGVLTWRVDLWSTLLFWLSLYRILNDMRVVHGRMHEQYLRRATRRTAWRLAASQAVVVALWLGWNRWAPSLSIVWMTLAAVQLAVAGVLLLGVARRLRRTAWPTQLKAISDGDLPSITVAIPARNETEDLQSCLESIIASDYPKLEIIVLDDRSQTRRTPEIIRSFAHDGVRFVLGDEPSDTWLPKNQAYERLANEASGEIIVFCGADVRFAPGSLRQLVLFMRERSKQMVSVLPERQPGAAAHFALIQAMRYWWELAPPRRLFQRPPVLSSCWAIEAAALKKAGGFDAARRTIVPEAYFAKRLIADDRYSFMRAGTALGIESAKLAADQLGTAVRTRYPQLHRRPENVWLVALLEFGFLSLTFWLPVVGLFATSIGTAAEVLSLLASLMLMATYELVVVSTRVNSWRFGVVAPPFATLADLWLLHYSMWCYEFGTVEWKGRDVAIPTMHVYPHLPELPD